MLLKRPYMRVIVSLLGLLFLLGIFLAVGLGYYLVSPAQKGAPQQVFVVRDGASLKEVAVELESNNLIKNDRFLLLWARLMGYGKDIKAGEYALSAGMPPVKILNILRLGMIIIHPVTIPEGFTSEQIGVLLDEKGLVDGKEFISLTMDPEISRRYGLTGDRLEGYLYPDTYHFSRGLPALSIIDTMVKRFRQMTTPLEARAAEIGMKMEDVVTLASIVEKETGVNEERPLIASVFLNRLKKRMRLDSDPTVIYGLKDFDGNLRKTDLSDQSPYNTYIIRGLPPGPISNPGLESIKAVLYPAQTDYLYFVSKNDGSHYFSKTITEHNNAVRIYQKRKQTRQKPHS
jgi:peptidoglycan lytic transglycosylase G